MRNVAAALLGLLLLLPLCSCGKKETDDMKQTEQKTILLINSVREADIWILPDTPANRKTTVWGTASASEVKTGERRQVLLCEPGENGRYLFRMIDTDGFYYSASGVILESGRSLQFEEDGEDRVTLAVTDETGATQSTYEVFKARL